MLSGPSADLVGQESVGNVARRQGHRRLQCAEVVDALVVPLVALLQPLPVPEHIMISTVLAAGGCHTFVYVSVICLTSAQRLHDYLQAY